MPEISTFRQLSLSRLIHNIVLFALNKRIVD